MSGRKNLYDLLGIAATATPEEIRAAYLLRTKVMHPDRFNQAEQPKEWKLANTLLEELNGAYATLRDPAQRSQYDQSLRKVAAPQPSYSAPRAQAYRPAATSAPHQPRTNSKTKQTSSVSTARPSRNYGPILMLLALGLLIGVIYLCPHWSSLLTSSGNTPVPVAAAPANPPVDILPFPMDGTLYGYSGSGTAHDLANEDRPGTALFTVYTAPDEKYFVKLVDADTNRPVLGFCASANATVTVKVPLGRYAVHYATGKNWHGLDKLFGPETSYSKLKKPVEFEMVGNTVPTRAIFLDRDVREKLNAESIAYSDF